MQTTVKKNAAKSVLQLKSEATLKDVPALAEIAIPQLYAEAEKSGLVVAGPIEFVYIGMDEFSDAPFQLSIQLPITKRKKLTHPHGIQQDRTKAIRCVSAEHHGSMETIRITYSALYHTVKENKYKLIGEVREVYHKWESYYSPFNITEIQIGIS
ncbi:MAG: hypothetical protein ACFCU1_03325 [Sumerlaeia bacterium]